MRADESSSLEYEEEKWNGEDNKPFGTKRLAIIRGAGSLKSVPINKKTARSLRYLFLRLKVSHSFACVFVTSRLYILILSSSSTNLDLKRHRKQLLEVHYIIYTFSSLQIRQNGPEIECELQSLPCVFILLRRLTGSSIPKISSSGDFP